MNEHEATRSCPVCSKEMRQDQKESVTIDVCEEHGIWLDKGELPTIISKIRLRQFRINRATTDKARKEGKMSGAMWGWWSLFME